MESLGASELFKMGVDPSLITSTQEKAIRVNRQTDPLIIGVPREIHNQETRVAITPASVGVLVANGHQVIVEHNAGIEAQFTDQEYTNAGAIIAYARTELFTKSKIIVKINPLAADEMELLQPRQTLISAVHLGGVKPDCLRILMDKHITAIGFEFLQASDGSLPLMRMMAEIAGITSIHIATELLSVSSGGKGLLLGGITGVPPATVAIIGAGTVGFHAARTALGLGAMVKVIDSEIYRLKRLEEIIGHKVYTAISQLHYIEDAVRSADVVIGATYVKGKGAACVVTEEMVAGMREGSVIVDVSIDQGGCVETSRPTTHDHPTFIKHGVIHYCVPNIASRVSRTASVAISNILTPILLTIGDAGSIQAAIGLDPGIKTGIYTFQRHVTQRNLASIFNLDFMDIDLLYAANIYGG